MNLNFLCAPSKTPLVPWIGSKIWRATFGGRRNILPDKFEGMRNVIRGERKSLVFLKLADVNNEAAWKTHPKQNVKSKDHIFETTANFTRIPSVLPRWHGCNTFMCPFLVTIFARSFTYAHMYTYERRKTREIEHECYEWWATIRFNNGTSVGAHTRHGSRIPWKKRYVSCSFGEWKKSHPTTQFIFCEFGVFSFIWTEEFKWQKRLLASIVMAVVVYVS